MRFLVLKDYKAQLKTLLKLLGSFQYPVKTYKIQKKI